MKSDMFYNPSLRAPSKNFGIVKALHSFLSETRNDGFGFRVAKYR